MKITNNYSQAGQDLFAAFCNNYKTNGFYLDCGSNEPVVNSNSFLLERDFGWYGIMIDFVDYLVERCSKQRAGHAFCADLSKTSLTDILDSHHAPEIIDYVSHDLDSEEARLFSIKSLDFNKYKVKCLTFEHDRYSNGDAVRNESRKFLQDNGMYLLCKDVRIDPHGEFEDWYINKDLVDYERVKHLESEGLEYREILALISPN